MKRIFFTFGFLCLAALAYTQPQMVFEQMTIDYGTVKKGAEPYREFKFRNQGTEPLLIKSAKGSCGCTVPTYSEQAIMPGESGILGVRYDTNRTGAFTKRITVTTNEPEDTKVLTVTGEVKPDEEGTPDAPSPFMPQN